MFTEDGFDLEAFERESEILHLILYRNRNQHHVSHWWKYFKMLHQKCFQLVDEYAKRTKQRERQSMKKKNKKRFDSRTPIWVQSKRIGQIAVFLYTKLIPSAHRNFHGILSQGAFITIGLALLGATARIYSLITPIVLVTKRGAEAAKRMKLKAVQLEKEEQERIKKEEKRMELVESVIRKTTELPEFDMGEPIEFDMGEPISREDIQGAKSSPVTKLEAQTDAILSLATKRPQHILELNEEPRRDSKRVKTKDAKKKSKKKGKKNAIDSIFGDF